jgi:hypothetical protein
MGIDKSKAMSLTPRSSQNLPNTGKMVVAGEKFSTPLRIQVRQHRDNYQRSLNSQLIPNRISFAAACKVARSYTVSIVSSIRGIATTMPGLMRAVVA